MSKNVPAVPQTFEVAMPDNAPALGFDPNAESFNWREVYPSNYFSMDELQELKENLGGWPVLTPARIVIKPVYDPAEWEGKEPPASELAPKLVLEFAESAPALVMNKSRCEMATKITGTPNPARWGGALPALVLTVGVYNRKAQIVIEPAPANGVKNGNGNGRHNGKTSEMTDEEMNEALFS